MPASAFSTCEVLGVNCVVGDIACAAEAVIDRALVGDGGYGILCNVHVLMTALREPELMRSVEGAWAVFPDGAPVAWLQRRVGMTHAKRIGGPDLMLAVIDRGRTRDLRHALFGSTPFVIERLAARLRAVLPDAAIVMTHAPDQGEQDDEALVRRIADCRPHVVWCALGAPKQEIWMSRWAGLLSPALLVGVGAAFDFHAGIKQRAPVWAQQMGLEWMHRLYCEPRRLAWRYLRTNSEFALRTTRVLAQARLMTSGISKTAEKKTRSPISATTRERR